jgi:hypothetical protein
LTPLKPTLERIVDVKLKVDEIRYKIINRYFWACAGVLAGGVLFTLGAYTRQPRLVSWGGIALAVTAIWGAASAGFHWQDNKDIRKLYGVIALPPDRLADIALSHLHWYYQEGMILKQEYVQPYVPFVPPPSQPFFDIHPPINAPGPGGYVSIYEVPPPSFTDVYNPNIGYAAAPSAPYLYSDQLET